MLGCEEHPVRYIELARGRTLFVDEVQDLFRQPLPPFGLKRRDLVLDAHQLAVWRFRTQGGVLHIPIEEPSTAAMICADSVFPTTWSGA